MIHSCILIKQVVRKINISQFICSCPAIAFRCNYGACIDGDLQCNRVANCADNSDEDPNLCKRWPPRRPTGTTTPSRPSPIPSTNTCKAPPQPENGHWKLHQLQCSNERDCNVPEGTELEKGSYLIYSCNSGYKLTGFSDIICDFQGQWPIIPNCTGIKLIIMFSKYLTILEKKIWTNKYEFLDIEYFNQRNHSSSLKRSKS